MESWRGGCPNADWEAEKSWKKEERKNSENLNDQKKEERTDKVPKIK